VGTQRHMHNTPQMTGPCVQYTTHAPLRQKHGSTNFPKKKKPEIENYTKNQKIRKTN